MKSVFAEKESLCFNLGALISGIIFWFAAFASVLLNAKLDDNRFQLLVTIHDHVQVNLVAD